MHNNIIQLCTCITLFSHEPAESYQGFVNCVKPIRNIVEPEESLHNGSGQI